MKRRSIIMLILVVLLYVSQKKTKETTKTTQIDNYIKNQKEDQNEEKIDMHEYNDQLLISKKERSDSQTITMELPTKSSLYKCDGREYCNQMHSCKEATFFINNCPNTKMDGDGDGVPCERQWCGH